MVQYTLSRSTLKELSNKSVNIEEIAYRAETIFLKKNEERC